MDKVTVLIASGGNSLSIPCRLFPDMETGKKRCDEIFGMEGKTESECVRYDIDLENGEEKPWPISTQLFTNFYYGCGGPYTFLLIEIDFDTKFVGFDLD